MKRTVLYAVLCSILLFVASVFLREKIFDLLFLFFENGNLNFNMHTVNSVSVIGFRISLGIAAIPLLLLAAWITGNITSSRKKIFSILPVMGCIALTILLNVFRIKGYEIKIAGEAYQQVFPFEAVYFEYAIAVGAIVGAAISYFIFRTRKRKEELNAAIKEIGKS